MPVHYSGQLVLNDSERFHYLFIFFLDFLVPTTDHPESAKNYSLLICEDSFSSIPLSILVTSSEQ